MPSIFSKLSRRKKSERVVLIASPPASFSPPAAPVADDDNLRVSINIPQTMVPDGSNVQASPVPSPATTDVNARQIPSTATTDVNARQIPPTVTTDVSAAQITKGSQKYRDEVTNNNEAGIGAVQEYKGRQQFFAAVTNNNIASSNSHNSNYGNTNSTITGDVFIHRAADGTELQISQRTTPNMLSPATPASTNAPESPASPDGPGSSPPTSPTQRIEGHQIFHGEMTNNNSLGSGTAQIIDGEQEFWGPVVNNNSRTINSHNSNANNVNSTITGNSYRVVRTARPSALAIGPDLNTILASILAGQNSTPNQARLLTNYEGQDAAFSEDQMNVKLKMAVAQSLAQNFR